MNTKSTKNKKIVNGVKKFQKAVAVSCTAITFMLSSALTTFAATHTPSGADTGTMKTLIDIVLWVVTGAVFFIGIVPSFINIVQGHQNEDHRQRNGGLSGIAIAGLIIAAIWIVGPILISF